MNSPGRSRRNDEDAADVGKGSGRGWPKHPDKELESLLRKLDDTGWRIERARKYYKALCPCGTHRRMIHISPSGPHYANQAVAWLKKYTCYGSEEG